MKKRRHNGGISLLLKRLFSSFLSGIFLLTLPYMILNYRKYGSVNKLRVLIFYSFYALLDDGLSLGDLASARSK